MIKFNFSVTYVGIIVMILGKITELLGLDIGTEALNTMVVTLVTIVGALIAFYGRWRKGGITPLGVKK